MNNIKNFFKFLISSNDTVSSNRVLGILFSIYFCCTAWFVPAYVIEYTFYLICLFFGFKAVEKIFTKKDTEEVNE